MTEVASGIAFEAAGDGPVVICLHGIGGDAGSFAPQLEALGGSMRNAVLVDNNRVVNEDGLRFEDEFARHKILDCIGDLALAEAPIFGHLLAHKPGHRLNHALLREMFAHQDRWTRLPYDEIMERVDFGESKQALEA